MATIWQDFYQKKQNNVYILKNIIINKDNFI